VEVARELLAAYPEYPGCVYVQNLDVDRLGRVRLSRHHSNQVERGLLRTLQRRERQRRQTQFFLKHQLRERELTMVVHKPPDVHVLAVSSQYIRLDNTRKSRLPNYLQLCPFSNRRQKLLQ
jgi:hypothetical protein